MLDLHDGVRELFLDAQQPVFDSIWKHYSLAKAAEYERKREWDESNKIKRRRIKAAYRARNRERLAADSRERYAKNKDYWRKRWLMKKALTG